MHYFNFRLMPTFMVQMILFLIGNIFGGVLYAALPIHLPSTDFEKIKKQFVLSTELKLLSSQAQTLSQQNNLQLISQRVDKQKTKHIRFQQYYREFLVYGGYAILHKPSGLETGVSSLNNLKVKMSGMLYGNLEDDLGSPPKDFIANSSLALSKFKEQYLTKKQSEAEVIPMIYVDKNHKAYWAYKVSLFIQHEDKIPERPTAIIDAESFQPLVVWNQIKTQFRLVKGKGFGGNNKIGKYEYGKDLPLLELIRDDDLEMCFMENLYVRVVDMKHKLTNSKRPMKFKCSYEKIDPSTFWTGYKNNGLDLVNDGYSPSNDALYSGQIIKDLYQNWYGLSVLLNEDDTPMQLIMRVHYGDGYENAYWDGRQMTFGDGAEFMYPLVSLGISSHEISHGFTEQHSNLEYYGQSGGINEAFSDMAAQAAEFYVSGNASFQLGSEILKEENSALRYMDMPSKDGHSIDSADAYYEELDVHYSSGVFNRLFYLLASKPNWNVRTAFDVMVKANMDYWTPYSTFVEAGCGIINAARDLNYSLEDVKQSFETISLDYSSCTL